MPYWMPQWFFAQTTRPQPRFHNFNHVLSQSGNYNVLAQNNTDSVYAQMTGPHNVVYADGNGTSLVYANGQGNNALLQAFLGSGNDIFYGYQPSYAYHVPNATTTTATPGQNVLIASNTNRYQIDTGAGDDYLDFGTLNGIGQLEASAGSGNDSLNLVLKNTQNAVIDTGSGDDIASTVFDNSTGTVSLGSGNDTAVVGLYNNSTALIDAIGTGDNLVVIEAEDSEGAYLGGIGKDAVALAVTNSVFAIDGNAGNDVIAVDAINSDLLVDGGNGNDEIDVTSDFLSTILLNGDNGADLIRTDGNGVVVAHGGNGNDTFETGGTSSQVEIFGGNGNNQASILESALASIFTYNGGLDNELFLANAGRGISATYNLIGGGADIFRLTGSPYASEFYVKTDSSDRVELAGRQSDWHKDGSTYTNYRNGNIVYLTGDGQVVFTS